MVVLDGDADERPCGPSTPSTTTRAGACDGDGTTAPARGHRRAPGRQRGAGSHASYFVAGEYMTEQELALAAPLRGMITALSHALPAAPQRAEREDPADRLRRLRPRRRRGHRSGARAHVGCAILVDEEAWATRYAGLWGAHVKDPFEGEDAPPARCTRETAALAARGSTRSASGPSTRCRRHRESPRSCAPAGRRIEERRPALDGDDHLAHRPRRQPRRRGSGGPRQRSPLVDPRNGWRRCHRRVERSASTELAAARRAQATARCARSPSTTRLAAIERGEVEPPGGPPRAVRHPDEGRGPSFRSLPRDLGRAEHRPVLLLASSSWPFVFPQLGVLAAVAVIAAFLFLDSVLRGTVAGVVSTITLTLAVVARCS